MACPEGAELSVLLTDDQGIRALNRDYRERDRATDVLSFAQAEGPAVPATVDGPPPPVLLGDVVLSVESAARQAAERGVTVEDECNRLLIHGVLHLLGHEHVGDPVAARKMRALERRLLALD